MNILCYISCREGNSPSWMLPYRCFLKLYLHFNLSCEQPQCRSSTLAAEQIHETSINVFFVLFPPIIEIFTISSSCDSIKDLSKNGVILNQWLAIGSQKEGPGFIWSWAWHGTFLECGVCFPCSCPTGQRHACYIWLLSATRIKAFKQLFLHIEQCFVYQ